MAISHAQLLLLLLVSIFFSSALCGPSGWVNFINCNTYDKYPVTVAAVEISPYPVKRSGNENITIYGLTHKEIPDGVTVNLKLVIEGVVSTKSYSLCDVTACPVAPGQFVLTLSNIFTPSEKKMATGYIAIVSITDKPLKKEMMCIFFNVKLIDHGSMINQVTE